MELTIAHLYPDSMSLYGEYANVAVLRRHLEVMGVEVTVRNFSCEDTPDFSDADFIYMGAGTEKRQKSVLIAAPHYTPALQAAAEGGAVVLFTGNAMETLGASVTDAKGQVWPGFALAEFTTVETDRRTPGDVVASPALWDAPAVGFMNKCSLTHGITTPLFKELSLGFGNDAEHGPEGYVSGSVFATHLTGPVLVKNPDFLDMIIRRLFARKGWELPERLPVLPHEREAYNVTLRELQARIK
ncbi:MAG: hypothetical protein K2O45_15980 [Oscillospiraceae bacterium]|nr:hypothetical protein [Oscillospiraceae bacterium]